MDGEAGLIRIFANDLDSNGTDIYLGSTADVAGRDGRSAGLPYSLPLSSRQRHAGITGAGVRAPYARVECSRDEHAGFRNLRQSGA
jgi:hypothetical protein